MFGGWGKMRGVSMCTLKVHAQISAPGLSNTHLSHHWRLRRQFNLHIAS